MSGVHITSKSPSSPSKEGWIRGNPKISPVLVVKVCRHHDHFGIEIEVESLFRGQTVSLVSIVNGIDRHVTESSETIPTEHVERTVTEKTVPKCLPRPSVTLSPISIPT